MTNYLISMPYTFCSGWFWKAVSKTFHEQAENLCNSRVRKLSIHAGGGR